jgi:hypothetical protein
MALEYCPNTGRLVAKGTHVLQHGHRQAVGLK